MNTLRKILIGTAALTGAVAMAGAAAAQVNANANVPINANIIAPITITAGQGLNFGTATTPASGGGSKTIIVSAVDGSRSGTATLLNTTGNQGQRGTFDIGGENGLAFNIEFTTTGMDPGFTIGSFTGDGCTYVSLDGDSGTGVLEATPCTLGVGATLTVAEGTSGLLTATLTTTVAYQ